jgi:SOS-response transcriptional repressor LexA
MVKTILFKVLNKIRRKRAWTRLEADFLKSLGRRCEQLRIKKGYSMDRVAKEGDGLSSSIVHRLEKGSGPVTVLSLYRYAQVLGLRPQVLLDLEPSNAEKTESKIVAKKKIKVLPPETFDRLAFKKGFLPLYSLKAAAGYFAEGESVEPEGWVEASVGLSLDEQMFVVRAQGESMMPKIHDGDYIVMRAHPAGTRQGKIVLAQYRGPADPETGGSYTLKQYESVKVATRDGEWRHHQIFLRPLNPAYEPILVNPRDKSDFRILAEYVATL